MAAPLPVVRDFECTQRTRYEVQLEGNPPNVFALNLEQMGDLIRAFGQKFANIEERHPAQGYEFHVLGGKELEVYIDACGRRAQSEELPLPEQGDKCPFCLPATEDEPLAQQLVTKQGNPLVVSTQHRDHWFQLGADEQVAMLWTANKVLKAHGKEKAKHHLSTHIGKFGHQTIRHAHMHLETGLGGGARK